MCEHDKNTVITMAACFFATSRLAPCPHPPRFLFLQGYASWLAIDLPTAVSLSGVEIAFEDGNERTQDFELVVVTEENVSVVLDFDALVLGNSHVFDALFALLSFSKTSSSSAR